MAKQDTFKVSKRGVEPVEVTWQKPESIDDPQWTEYGVDQNGINELAAQNLVIKIQGVARGEVENGADAVQKKVDEYKFGQRATTTRTAKVKIGADEAKKAKFSKEQLAMLRAAGVQLEGMEDEENAA